MRISVPTRLSGVYRRGVPLLAMLLVLGLAGGGCARMRDAIDPKPSPEITVQSGSFGTVTQVSTGKMQGREVNRGDIALTVDLDTGGVVIIVQPEDDIYTVGDRVRVIRDGEGFVRVQLVI